MFKAQTRNAVVSFPPTSFLQSLGSFTWGFLSVPQKKIEPRSVVAFAALGAWWWGTVGGGDAVGDASSQGQGAELGSGAFWEPWLLLVLGSKVTSFP